MAGLLMVLQRYSRSSLWVMTGRLRKSAVSDATTFENHGGFEPLRVAESRSVFIEIALACGCLEPSDAITRDSYALRFCARISTRRLNSCIHFFCCCASL